jgi:hypothetical protein
MVGMEAPANHPIHSFHAALRNLQKLEQDDFREIIKSQLRPTLRERYLTVNYHRAVFNVEMMVAVKDTRQFQTLSLLARTIFELALEVHHPRPRRGEEGRVVLEDGSFEVGASHLS